MKLCRRTRIHALRLALSAAALALVSCFSLRPVSVPIGNIEYVATARDNKTLIVFLPGIFDSADDFERHGWIKAVRDRALAFDMIAVDAHYGYYSRGRLIERLQADIIRPARKRGYLDIWLVGVSLGGFGSLLYAKAHPDDITGICLISPFLGNPRQRFDPAEWLGRRHGHGGLWRWLARPPPVPAIFLAYGRQDKFAAVNGRLAQFLAPDHIVRLPGEHDWPTWNALWGEALERKLFSLPKVDIPRRHSLSQRLAE